MENTRPSKPCHFEKGDWADLPADILVLIAERLVSLKDFVFFCSVCKPWQTVASIVQKFPPRSPLVMLPEDEKNKETQTRRFYSLATSKLYEFGLPEASGKTCFLAGYGWLWTFDGYDFQINLLHPFSRRQIKLPSKLAFKGQYEYDNVHKPERVASFFITKVVLSKYPRNNVSRSSENDDFTAVAIGEFGVLAFARARDKVWTRIAISTYNSCNILRVHDDVIYYKDMFYAVDCHGVLFICDIEKENDPQVIAIAPSPVGYNSTDQNYLVESSGNLLMLSRVRDDILWEGYDTVLGHTVNFSIYRLDKDPDTRSKYTYKWTRIKDLDGRAMFLGNNVSTSLPPSDGVKANCIYFTEDDTTRYVDLLGGGGYDTGVFDVERNTIEKHYASNFCCSLSPPSWYILY